MANYALGLDLSFSKANAGWWVQRKAEGFQAMAQCLDTGGVNINGQLVPTAEENLMNALAAGLRISGYLNATPWKSGTKAVQHAQTVAGDAWNHMSVLFVDIEIDGVDQTRIHETCEAAKATGKAVAVYSARWFWQKIGNPKWPWLLEYGLWVADYDNDPNVATSALFGPWAQATHKQYTNTTDVQGVQIDYNTFDLDLWEDDMGMTPEEKQQLDNATNDIKTLSAQLADATKLAVQAAEDNNTQAQQIADATALAVNAQNQLNAHEASPHAGGEHEHVVEGKAV